MDIALSKRAAKVLQGIDKLIRARIISGIHKIPDGDIKPLEGNLDGWQRLRIGKYRVIFFYEDENGTKTLHISDVGSRGDICK